jgi:hypothetical protein
MKRSSWIVSVALTCAVALSAVAVAGAAGNTQVRGVQRPAVASDGCGVGDGYAWMNGSGERGTAGLIGCWWITGTELGVVTPSGVVTGTGTELFAGCLDQAGDGACDPTDPAGTLSFFFRFSLKYDPTFTTFEHGRCYHPVTGGTGGFAGATGSLQFHDDPVTGCSYYSGHLKLG